MYFLYTEDNISESSSPCAHENRRTDSLLSRKLFRAMLQQEFPSRQGVPCAHSSATGSFQEISSSDMELSPIPAKGKYGKPYLPACPSLHFNISHSGGIGVLCVDNKEVGVDLQWKGGRTAKQCLRIAAHFFPQEDLQLLQALPSPEEQTDLFFRLWTIREAYLKLTGKGLAGGLDSFHIDLENRQILKRTEEPAQAQGSNDDPEDSSGVPGFLRTNAYYAELSMPSVVGPEYCGAVCSFSPIPPEVHTVIV